MTRHPPSPTLTAALLQLLAAWLAAILLVQGLQAARALGAGPRHAHISQAADPGHSHDGFERHHHRLDDASVQHDPTPDTSLDAAQLALTLALALMAFGAHLHRLPVLGQVQRAAPAWFWRTRTRQPLLRPPRPA